jgi:hypothetical protein
MDASLIEQVKLKYVDLIKDPGIGHGSSVAATIGRDFIGFNVLDIPLLDHCPLAVSTVKRRLPNSSRKRLCQSFGCRIIYRRRQLPLT